MQSVEFELVIRPCQQDQVIIIYPSHFIENFEIDILDQLFNVY